MRALAGGIPAQLILNVRAGAQVGLPDDAVAEVPCTVTAAGVAPLPTTPLGLARQGLVAQVKAVERATIEAATTSSREAAVRAFALHPLIDSVTIARALVRDYCAAAPTLDAALH